MQNDHLNSEGEREREYYRARAGSHYQHRRTIHFVMFRFDIMAKAGMARCYVDTSKRRCSTRKGGERPNRCRLFRPQQASCSACQSPAVMSTEGAYALTVHCQCRQGDNLSAIVISLAGGRSSPNWVDDRRSACNCSHWCKRRGARAKGKAPVWSGFAALLASLHLCIAQTSRRIGEESTARMILLGCRALFGRQVCANKEGSQSIEPTADNESGANLPLTDT